MNIETKVVDGTTVFAISADVSFENKTAMATAINVAVASASTSKFLVDISQVRHVNSNLLYTLLAINKSVVSRQGRFGIIASEFEPREVLLLAGLNRLFPIFDNEEQAIKSV